MIKKIIKSVSRNRQILSGWLEPVRIYVLSKIRHFCYISQIFWDAFQKYVSNFFSFSIVSYFPRSSLHEYIFKMIQYIKLLHKLPKYNALHVYIDSWFFHVFTQEVRSDLFPFYGKRFVLPRTTSEALYILCIGVCIVKNILTVLPEKKFYFCKCLLCNKAIYLLNLKKYFLSWCFNETFRSACVWIGMGIRNQPTYKMGILQ